MKKLMMSLCACALLTANVQRAQAWETVGAIYLGTSAVAALGISTAGLVGSSEQVPYSQVILGIQNDIAVFDATGVMTVELEAVVDQVMKDHGLTEEETLDAFATMDPKALSGY